MDDTADELEETTKVETIDVTQREDGYGDRPVTTVTASIHQAKSAKEKYDEYAMILRRRVNKDREEFSTALEIRSAIIRQGVRTVIGDYPYLNLMGCPITIYKPYVALFHYRQEIYNYSNSASLSKKEKQYMEVLTTFMKLNLGQTEKMYDRLVPNGLISFSYLWTLFRPGDIVVRHIDERVDCFEVISTENKVKDDEKYLQLTTHCWDYDGTRFGRLQVELIIHDFSGVRKILDMSIYPMHQLPPDKQVSLEAEIIARGHKWRSLVSVNHREYDGK
jgi:hypothetical protein